jgi:hypothetical protein
MQSAVFEIEQQLKNCHMDVARFGDFRCGPQARVDARRIRWGERARRCGSTGWSAHQISRFRTR